MAQATLLEMAREIHLYSDEVCPIPMATRWVRDRYRKICERTLWSFKLGRGTFYTPAEYATGTVTMTNDSTTVTGSSTVWTSTHVSQQFVVEGTVFTISAVGGNTSLTLDQKWYGATESSLTYSIRQAYITPTPTDFHAFYSVVDVANSWPLQLGINVKEIDRIDARRASTGTPRLLANGVYNSSNAAVFELWPHPTALTQYMYTYEKRVTDLVNATDTPPSIIRSDVIVKGALADLARWPGTAERRNPMYDLYFTQWKNREAEFESELNRLIVEDQSILLTDLSFTHGSQIGVDARYMQNHAF